MWDNHTFTSIDLSDPGWRDEVMECWDGGRFGHFFVRQGQGSRDIFVCADYKATREEFAAKLLEFEPEANYTI